MNAKNTTTALRVSDKMLKKSFDEICALVAQTSDKRLIVDFFECLFTPAECKDFANRWLLVKEIDKGTTQREIAKKFGMSLCKITRGSRELHKEHSAFRTMLEKLKDA
ncbi:MAG: transcriptional regulator [Treponema sp.]|nr:transcriptional regulator [Treponema sp.]